MSIEKLSKWSITCFHDHPVALNSKLSFSTPRWRTHFFSLCATLRSFPTFSSHRLSEYKNLLAPYSKNRLFIIQTHTQTHSMQHMQHSHSAHSTSSDILFNRWQNKNQHYTIAVDLIWWRRCCLIVRHGALAEMARRHNHNEYHTRNNANIYTQNCTMR